MTLIFNLKLYWDEITSDVALIVTDFASDDEKEKRSSVEQPDPQFNASYRF